MYFLNEAKQIINIQPKVVVNLFSLKNGDLIKENSYELPFDSETKKLLSTNEDPVIFNGDDSTELK